MTVLVTAWCRQGTARGTQTTADQRASASVAAGGRTHHGTGSSAEQSARDRTRPGLLPARTQHHRQTSGKGRHRY